MQGADYNCLYCKADLLNVTLNRKSKKSLKLLKLIFEYLSFDEFTLEEIQEYINYSSKGVTYKCFGATHLQWLEDNGYIQSIGDGVFHVTHSLTLEQSFDFLNENLLTIYSEDSNPDMDSLNRQGFTRSINSDGDEVWCREW